MASSTTASQTELKANKVPLGWRDKCSARDTMYLPWKCEDERHVYEKTTSYVRRMKALSKQKLAAAEEAE
ncbi:hypothetical protein PC9H_005510 [Pleurotus ostreatus]|uniref:Uncharacterized protein n=1 Tax=Pleurotus ostreatus TaxID=5322 RepID=A0A8H7DUG0_PLEOS|nr:uncharacterized protein PC9H_005510 [Pleurotus ostreatus]KAF7433552.1 hypothetical protein PC9H_005510 [Pleurotus ostreatus]